MLPNKVYYICLLSFVITRKPGNKTSPSLAEIVVICVYVGDVVMGITRTEQNIFKYSFKKCLLLFFTSSFEYSHMEPHDAVDSFVSLQYCYKYYLSYDLITLSLFFYLLILKLYSDYFSLSIVLGCGQAAVIPALVIWSIVIQLGKQSSIK